MESPNEYRERVSGEFEKILISGSSHIVDTLNLSRDRCDIRKPIRCEIPICEIGEYPDEILWKMYIMRRIYESKGWNVRFISSTSNPGDSTFYNRCRDATDDDILDSTLDIYFMISEPTPSDIDKSE